MRKQLMILIAALALSTSLAGCGGAGSNEALTTATTFSSTQGQVSASDYQSVNEAHQQATSALYEYQDLRTQWERTSSNTEKDNIENQMLNVLTQALKDIRQTSSAGYGYDARQVYDIANNALDEYDQLRGEWQRAFNVSEKRQIVNDMLNELTSACKQVQQVQPRS